MIINSFPKVVKDILRGLPKNDYPVLNSRLFFECWLSYALDNSLTSMRDLFNRLNNTGFEVDISTFSKANLHRSQKPFQEIYQKLNKLVQNKFSKKLHDKYAICPIDSTIITLTSKLLWVLGHHQVKLFSSLNLATGSPSDNFINFGHEHDYKFGSKMMSNLPINAVGVTITTRRLKLECSGDRLLLVARGLTARVGSHLASRRAEWGNFIGLRRLCFVDIFNLFRASITRYVKFCIRIQHF
ncbi:transposase, IS4 family protein [Richelia sinica FACHB-800]|uniref:Transposase, IS4 family protein n=1 Tax=Richelia sinica FACHB-800 TaxID=1357546 RepID=A0A975T3G7_9NOST|nr:transposase, IS4 family protein [Richelia sinica FACHB-800]